MNPVILLLLLFYLGRQDNNGNGGNNNNSCTPIQPREGNSFTRPFMTFGQGGNTCSCEVQSDS